MLFPFRKVSGPRGGVGEGGGGWEQQDHHHTLFPTAMAHKVNFIHRLLTLCLSARCVRARSARVRWSEMETHRCRQMVGPAQCDDRVPEVLVHAPRRQPRWREWKKTKKTQKHNSWNRSGWFTEFTHVKTIALWQWPSKDQLSRRLNPTTLELLIPIMKIWKELESSNHSNNLQKFPLIYYRCQIMEQPKSKYQSFQKSTKIYCFIDTRDNDYFWFSCIIVHILMGDEWVCERDCMCVCVCISIKELSNSSREALSNFHIWNKNPCLMGVARGPGSSVLHAWSQGNQE